MDLVPRNWPLVGIAAEAFKVPACRHPKRPVFGVPHPTGSRGKQWRGMFNHGSLKLGKVGRTR